MNIKSAHTLALSALLSCVMLSATAQTTLPTNETSFQIASGLTSSDVAYDRADTQIAYLENQLAIADSNDDDDDNDNLIYNRITRGSNNLNDVRYVVVNAPVQLRNHPAYNDLKTRVYNLRSEYISRGLPVGTFADWNYDGYTLTQAQKQAVNNLEKSSRDIGMALQDTAQSYSVALDNSLDQLEMQLQQPIFNTREFEGFRANYMAPQLKNYRVTNQEKRVNYVQSTLDKLNKELINLKTGTEQEIKSISTDVKNTLMALDRMEKEGVDTDAYTFSFYPDQRTVSYIDIRNELKKVDHSPMDYKKDAYLPH